MWNGNRRKVWWAMSMQAEWKRLCPICRQPLWILAQGRMATFITETQERRLVQRKKIVPKPGILLWCRWKKMLSVPKARYSPEIFPLLESFWHFCPMKAEKSVFPEKSPMKRNAEECRRLWKNFCHLTAARLSAPMEQGEAKRNFRRNWKACCRNGRV